MIPQKTMKAAVLRAPRDFVIQDVPVPKVGADDVLIAVSWCGVCGTDIHIFKGDYSANKLPLILGHEFTGVIAALGDSVNRFQLGQKVVVDMNIGCNHCFWCRKNEILNCPEMQQLGITINGAFAEYISVSSRQVIPVKGHISDRTLALTEPLACVVRAMRKSHIGMGQSVVVLGAGAIGNMHIQMLRNIGVAPIIAVDLSEKRAKLAVKVGADVCSTNLDDLHQNVYEMTDGRGADVVIEAVGLPELYAQANKLIRKGGHIAVFGLTAQGENLQLDIHKTILEENSIKGSVAGMGQDMYDALNFLTHKRIDTSPFTSKEYMLDDIQHAFETIEQTPQHFKTQIRIH